MVYRISRYAHTARIDLLGGETLKYQVAFVSVELAPETLSPSSHGWRHGTDEGIESDGSMWTSDEQTVTSHGHLRKVGEAHQLVEKVGGGRQGSQLASEIP